MIIAAVTGASGSIYADSLLSHLATQDVEVSVIFSETAKKVCLFELQEKKLEESIVKRLLTSQLLPAEKEKIRCLRNDDFFAPIASGTSRPSKMVVVPCSMGTLSRIRHGMSTCLIERAADVALKQKRPLVLAPRESPLSTIHLENMLAISQMGASIVPLMPGFYQKPQKIEELVAFMTGRICEMLDVSHSFYNPWNS